MPEADFAPIDYKADLAAAFSCTLQLHSGL
jgi:hypothetical protein